MYIIFSFVHYVVHKSGCWFISRFNCFKSPRDLLYLTMRHVLCRSVHLLVSRDVMGPRKNVAIMLTHRNIESVSQFALDGDLNNYVNKWRFQSYFFIIKFLFASFFLFWFKHKIPTDKWILSQISTYFTYTWSRGRIFEIRKKMFTRSLSFPQIIAFVVIVQKKKMGLKVARQALWS